LEENFGIIKKVKNGRNFKGEKNSWDQGRGKGQSKVKVKKEQKRRYETFAWGCLGSREAKTPNTCAGREKRYRSKSLLTLS